MQSQVRPEDALQRAVQSLLDGPADGTSIEGAKVNALESIAWSLIGLLAKQDAKGDVETTLTDVVQRAGFVDVQP